MINELILEIAQRLAERLEADIPLCRTRDEHVRVTARANEARQMYNELKSEYHIFTVSNGSF
jgi:N-acetylmuramoyl-L-alanine amidase